MVDRIGEEIDKRADARLVRGGREGQLSTAAHLMGSGRSRTRVHGPWHRASVVVLTSSRSDSAVGDPGIDVLWLVAPIWVIVEVINVA